MADIYEKIASLKTANGGFFQRASQVAREFQPELRGGVAGAAAGSLIGGGTQYVRHWNDTPEARRAAAIQGAGYGAVGGGAMGVMRGLHAKEVQELRGVHTTDLARITEERDALRRDGIQARHKLLHAENTVDRGGLWDSYQTRLQKDPY